MRSLLLLLSASLLALASGAGAQTMPYPQADAEPASAVQAGTAARTTFITPEQASQINGSYTMSNGWKLKVNARWRYADVTIDSEKPMRLHAVEADKFVSRDGNTTMQFNQGELGDEMTMSYVPDARLAEMVVISSRMAQR